MIENKTKFLMVICLLLLVPGSVFAHQEGEPLQLSLVRNFGYGGIGEIQGSFTLKIKGPPEGLAAVSFYLDGLLLEEVNAPPFEFKFHTSDFVDGRHQMSAFGVLEDGRTLSSNSISKVFLSSDDAWDETQKIIVPLLVGVGALTLIGVGLPVLFSRKKEYVPGEYGLAGGAVCPRCGLPFSRPYLAPNMLVGKLVRCPHCGKISVLPQSSLSSLQEAERRYAGQEAPQSLLGGERDYQDLIEESRFDE